jgi:hypothetical protein
MARKLKYTALGWAIERDIYAAELLGRLDRENAAGHFYPAGIRLQYQVSGLECCASIWILIHER